MRKYNLNRAAILALTALCLAVLPVAPGYAAPDRDGAQIDVRTTSPTGPMDLLSRLWDFVQTVLLDDGIQSDGGDGDKGISDGDGTSSVRGNVSPDG